MRSHAIGMVFAVERGGRRRGRSGDHACCAIAVPLLAPASAPALIPVTGCARAGARGKPPDAST